MEYLQSHALTVARFVANEELVQQFVNIAKLQFEYLQSHALTVARFVANEELVQQVQMSVAAAEAFSVRFQQAFTALEN
jgi:hypothetical protein